MSFRLTRATDTAVSARPAVRVRRLDGTGVDRSFAASFYIGRDDECQVQVDSGLASRRHVEVALENGHWVVRDLGSTNGTFVNGARIRELRVDQRLVLRLGEEGPEVEITIQQGAAKDEATRVGSGRPLPKAETKHFSRTGGPSDAPLRDSVSGYISKYFSGGGGPAGEHTQMIRQAYQTVHEQNRRKYTRMILGAGLIVVLAVLYAGWQHFLVQRLENRAAESFRTMRQLDVQSARIQQYIEEQGDATLAEQLTALTQLRLQNRQQYEGYVEELGLRRRLTEDERAIYRVARIFNESEFEMPAMFVRAVRETIDEYWLTPAGRARFRNAIARAEREGYTEHIVQSMMQQGLPPEFFYLALQESNFEAEAVGPRTRWGIAKGMWQFIPETARAYGLVTGPREEQRAFDPQDERHVPAAATVAASRYLLEIYGQLAQASGLLAMASYNWGERRVVSKLEDLLEGIPDDPEARSYWRFLSEYSERMPDETKDYVLKIFAAAAIGQNPRLFGFDFDNPLQPYIEAESRVPVP